MDVGLLIGGKYRLKKLIGAGAMGQVWIGTNEMTEREFALKLLLPKAASNPEIVTRFVQEAKISGRLRHPSILEIYDVGTASELNGAPFLVMELLHGVSLDAAIRSLKGLPLRFSLEIAIAITRALGAAHGKRVVHRDLKPANVFLHRDDAGSVVPKLLDFGISKLAAVDAAGDDALGLTHTGALLGSPRFMSPEQIVTQKDIDGRSDIHALGVLVWWCLLARSPFVETIFHNLMVEILNDRRPILMEEMPDVPPGVNEFVTRAMSRKREDRYQTAAEALVVLEAELEKLGPGPTLTTRSWVEEILAPVVAPPPPTMSPSSPPREELEAKEMTTHGAVSVSVEPAATRAVSGAEYPVPTDDAVATSNGESVRESARPPPLAPMSTLGRDRSRAWLGIGAAGIFVVGAVVVSLRGYARSHPRAAAGADTTSVAAAVVPPPPASLVATDAAPSASASVVASATPPPVPTVSAVASSTHPPHWPAGAGGRPPTPKATAGEAKDNDPFHGVTGTGL